MNDHQPKTFMGIDLAACDELSRPDGIIAVPEGENPAAYLKEMRRICRNSRPQMIFTASVADLGVSVEEAPEGPQDSPARRVTVADIEAKIVKEDYFQGLNGSTLTICVLTMANGFTVTGESPCVDPANFDEDLGKKYARADAFKKIWLLEGYLLREKMWQDSYPDPCSPPTPLTPGDEQYREPPHEARARAADEGWDDPEAVADADFHPNALIGTQSASATFTNGAWMRQRAYELAQVDNRHGLGTRELIENARQIEDYLAGKPEPEAVTEAAPPTDAQLIQRAKDVLVDAVTRGEAPACDQAADAIQAMADWLNQPAVAD